ncbi:hypothetical protein C1645_833492 [Glomus cerebriforme]|uniref:Uncharacterized protein n=1 Tax=Glomus cerebriforme TaxID=658196 RepID=A0A397SFL0_9GLOM|nr:hypothetical protein C1645_833492 [Glomus cerebriforme]
MFHFRLNNKKLKLNTSSGDLSFDFNLFLDYSVSEGLVIDQDCWDGEEDTEDVLFHILIRDDDDEIGVILEGVDDVILRRGSVDVILGRGQDGVDEFLSVKGVEDVGEGRLLCGVLEWDESWNDINKDVDKDRLFRGVLGWDDIDESRLFHERKYLFA